MLSSLIQFWRGNLSIVDMLFILLSYAVMIFVLLPVHECAHAFVADRLGDSTARWNGRLTLNPMRHLDPLGAVMLLLFGIGYAKPVPVNANNFRKPKRDMALTALAGPLANLLMAILSVGLFRLIVLICGGDFTESGFWAPGSVSLRVMNYAYLMLIQVLASINISLAVFNLLPIPPLDGSRIFSAILPDKWSYAMMRYERIIMLVVFVLLFTGVLDTPLYWLRRGFGFVVCKLFGMPNLF